MLFLGTLLWRVLEKNDPKKFKIALLAKGDPNFFFGGKTLLQWAVILERPEVIRLLLESKADPDLQDPNGLTPLHEALLPEKSRSKLNEMVQLLLGANANLNVPDNKGVTPLEVADRMDNKEIAVLFTKHLVSRHQSRFNVYDSCPYATLKLCVNVPVGLSGGESLCETLVEHLDLVYTELDRLPRSGIALGLDLLPSDVSLADPLDSEIFSGKFQCILID